MKKTVLVFLVILSINIAVVIPTIVSQVRAEEKTIDELIKDLGNDDWPTREKATKELIEKGKEDPSKVLPIVRRAKYDKDPEIRTRARLILVPVMKEKERKEGNFFDEVSTMLKKEFESHITIPVPTPPEHPWWNYLDRKEDFFKAFAQCDVDAIEKSLNDLIAAIKQMGDAVLLGDILASDKIKNNLTDNSDGDGMPYWWEKKWGLDPAQDDGAKHADTDGLTNLEEYNKVSNPKDPKSPKGTNPTDPDTDGDGSDDKKDEDPLQAAYLHTPVGSSVLVSLGKEAAVVFSEVIEQGYTLLYPSPTPTYTPPSGFRFIGYSFDVYTTVQYTGPITVTFRYDESWLLGKEMVLKLFHWNDHTLEWEDVTVSIDTLNNIITGSGYSLSPFVMAEPAPPVGGVAVLIDKSKPDPLTPYIGLATTILVTIVATAIYVKHIKCKKEKQ